MQGLGAWGTNAVLFSDEFRLFSNCLTPEQEGAAKKYAMTHLSHFSKVPGLMYISAPPPPSPFFVEIVDLPLAVLIAYMLMIWLARINHNLFDFNTFFYPIG